MSIIGLVRKFAAMTVHHIDCGMFSGIPQCCVLWASFVYLPVERLDQLMGWSPRPAWHAKLSSVWRYTNPLSSPKHLLGRIECPYCSLFGKPIKMNRCDRHEKCKDFMRTSR